ncbi:MAG: molybdenum cofactor biosynthesis protein MoaE [Methanobacteriota archaeon]|nr:MAG: molybdenum cofactor biosynthesis protein MoaE [Euryarchaeota archaeon]
MIRVQKEDFSVEEEIKKVKAASKRIGGIVVFLGTARDFTEETGDVEKLEFEHYPGMAEKKLEELRAQAMERFDIIEASIIHRYGQIPAGENIVLIVVGAMHRKDAFDACRWLIDELKQIVPIWKKEHTKDGEVWVTEHP